MIEEAEEYRSSIPGIRMIREIMLPRWALEEDQPEVVSIPLPPEADVESDPFFVSRSPRKGFSFEDTEFADAPSPEERFPEFQHTESFYNENGLLIDKRQFESANLTQRERFAYDENGRLVRKTIEDHVDENLEKEERQYGFDGKIRKKIVTYSDHSQQVTEHQWVGNTDERIVSSSDGIESRDKQTYDEHGRLVESVDIDLESGQQSGLFHEYDAAGNLVTLGIIESDGTRWISETYEYDNSGNEVAWAEFDREGNTSQERLSTYDNGDCHEMRLLDSNGETITSQEFDEDHRVIHSSTLGPGIEAERVSVYDSSGLWILQASRSIQDGRVLGGWGGPTAIASTIWREYEFFSK